MRWQHVLPTARLHGLEGTLHVIRQLEGYEAPSIAWETHILPSRVADYRPGYLDALCHSGEVMWGRLSPHPALTAGPTPKPRRIRPTRIAPVAIFLREHADALVGERSDPSSALSHAAREILAAIDRRGAPFFAEIVAATRRLPAEVEEALWELVAAGLVTADGFDALRSLIERKRRLGRSSSNTRPRASSGRWSRLCTEPSVTRVESFVRTLLARWGIVSRDVIAHETLAPPWREILGVLRRLEARGEIRGGRFVAAILGEQFATMDAVETLRAVRRSGAPDEHLNLADSDPLRLIAPILSADSQKTGSFSRDALAHVTNERRIQGEAIGL